LSQATKETILKRFLVRQTMLQPYKTIPKVFYVLYCIVIPAIVVVLLTPSPSNAFVTPRTLSIQDTDVLWKRVPAIDTTKTTTTSSSPKQCPSRSPNDSVFGRRHMVNGGGSDDDDASRTKLKLREEAESPFRKVRFFLYITLAGGAFTGLAISVARIAAALFAGVNEDLLQESLINAGVDLAGLTVVGVLYRRDQQAEASRLKRAARGAGLAQLSVRASKSVLDGDLSPEGSTFTTTLASLRRGRGIDKRVVIAAAGKDKIAKVLQEAKVLERDMEYNDILLVPVVMPQGVAPSGDTMLLLLPNKSVALPIVKGNNWKLIIDDEAAEAVQQGVNIEDEGFCVVLKKNGRVGQRTRGIFLENLVSNVVKRREAGMDVTNI
jgi:hypothetical protein